MVKDEKRAGNPVAAAIVQLQLERNSMVMRLPDLYGLTVDDEGDEGAAGGRSKVGEGADSDSGEDSDEEEEVQQPLRFSDVDIDLALGAFANARSHYEARKKKTEKVNVFVCVLDSPVYLDLSLLGAVRLALTLSINISDEQGQVYTRTNIDLTPTHPTPAGGQDPGCQREGTASGGEEGPGPAQSGPPAGQLDHCGPQAVLV